MTDDKPLSLVTSDHQCYLNAGGLVLIEADEVTDDMDLEDIAAHDESLALSPDEALRIAAFVEQHRLYLEERAKELDRFFTRVATAWLDEFTEQAHRFVQKQMYWWPEIRHEADTLFLDLLLSGKNPVIQEWERQCRRQDFPRLQQLTLLTRYFQRLYYQRYPIPQTDQGTGPMNTIADVRAYLELERKLTQQYTESPEYQVFAALSALAETCQTVEEFTNKAQALSFEGHPEVVKEAGQWLQIALDTIAGR